MRVEYLAPAETVGLVDGEIKVVPDSPVTVKHVDGDLKVVSDPDGAVLTLAWTPAEKLTRKEDIRWNSFYLERLADPTIDPETRAELQVEWDAKPAYDLDHGDRFYSGRNYWLFTLLAGVRGDPEDALWDDRGFPEDASDEVREEFEDWGVDAHTPSWQTLDELTEIDWKEVMTEDSQFYGQDWLNTITKMEALAIEKCGGDQTSVRITYWFDN